MQQKFLKLVNFRDLGGISSATGKKVRTGRLLRSGELSSLPQEDIRVLKEVCHLVNIVDLRTENERTASPDTEISGTHYTALDFFPGEAAGKADCSEDRLESMPSVEALHETMESTYVSFVADETVRSALHEFLRLLLRTETGATLFHCFAGKDRTGITAAVILTVLGVSKEAIMEDYLETNALRREANEQIIGYFQKQGKTGAVLDTIRAALCVEARYLERAYEAAEERYGSFEGYILDGIGLAESDWEKLRLMYLE